MAAIDVADRDIRLVREILDRCLPRREVRVMGSRVTGRSKPFSDLDLVIMGDAPLDLATLGDLREAFDESELPFAVDLIEWATASEGFRNVIAMNAQPLTPSSGPPPAMSRP